MNRGVPPTARKARTGEFTPPGITRWARSNSSAEAGASITVPVSQSLVCDPAGMNSRGVVRRSAVLLACALALLGCTSSGNRAEQFRRKLTAVLLQLSDFPPTWRAFPMSQQDPNVLTSLAACVGGKGTHASPIAVIHSEEFRHADERISSAGAAFSSQDPVSDAATALGKPAARRCMAQVMRTRITEAVPGASVTGSHWTVQPGGINVPINYAGLARGVIDATRNGAPVKIYADVVFITGASIDADVTLVNVGRPIAKYIRDSVVDDIAGRAQRAT